MASSAAANTGSGTWFRFRFTPAEWRRLLADPAFLWETGNSYAPRRLMGIDVVIVPDHGGAPGKGRTAP